LLGNFPIIPLGLSAELSGADLARNTDPTSVLSLNPETDSKLEAEEKLQDFESWKSLDLSLETRRQREVSNPVDRVNHLFISEHSPTTLQN
jgi:hypothetical protein